MATTAQSCCSTERPFPLTLSLYPGDTKWIRRTLGGGEGTKRVFEWGRVDSAKKLLAVGDEFA